MDTNFPKKRKSDEANETNEPATNEYELFELGSGEWKVTHLDRYGRDLKIDVHGSKPEMEEYVREGLAARVKELQAQCDVYRCMLDERKNQCNVVQEPIEVELDQPEIDSDDDADD